MSGGRLWLRTRQAEPATGTASASSKPLPDGRQGMPVSSDDQRAVVGLCRVSSRPEQQIQRAVFEHLAIRAASTVFAFHPANGGWRSRVEAAILKGMGLRAGVPDIIAIKGGRCYALELKASDGRLTPAQRDAHAALVASGATVEVACGPR
jgi:hypothetical protein